MVNLRRVERKNEQGLTLGQIADWVNDCRTQGIPDAMVVHARVTFRGRLRAIAAESSVSPVSPMPIKSTFAKGGVIDPKDVQR